MKPDLERVYDPEKENPKRAKWAQQVIDTHMAATGSDDCDALGDLLANLMHLCDQRTRNKRGRLLKNPPEGWDFNKALDMAVMHYTAETNKVWEG
jgi:hypothetical protein